MTTIDTSILNTLGIWFQAQRGATRSWRTCASRVETLYRVLSAWHGEGYVEVMMMADPSGAWLDSHVAIVVNGDFTWSTRRNRTNLEKRAVMLGGTGKRDWSKELTWAVPTRPLDGAGRNLDWRGRDLTPPGRWTSPLARREYEARTAA